jgi:hypothetical protein
MTRWKGDDPCSSLFSYWLSILSTLKSFEEMLKKGNRIERQNDRKKESKKERQKDRETERQKDKNSLHIVNSKVIR